MPTALNRMMPGCVFCEIVAGTAPATVVRRTPVTLTMVPLDPVVPGHLVVLPVEHVADFTVRPSVSAEVMHQAANISYSMGPCNLITSKGPEATQTIFHLHLHIVPRAAGDGLKLPWSDQRR